MAVMESENITFKSKNGKCTAISKSDERRMFNWSFVNHPVSTRACLLNKPRRFISCFSLGLTFRILLKFSSTLFSNISVWTLKYYLLSSLSLFISSIWVDRFDYHPIHIAPRSFDQKYRFIYSFSLQVAPICLNVIVALIGLIWLNKSLTKLW